MISAVRFIEMIGERRPYISLNELRAIQGEYGISVDALMYKAKELGIITESRYKSFCIRKSSNFELRKRIEESIFQNNGASPSRFVRLVYRALASGGDCFVQGCFFVELFYCGS